MTTSPTPAAVASEEALADFIYEIQNYADAKEKAALLFAHLEHQAKALSEAEVERVETNRQAVYLSERIGSAWHLAADFLAQEYPDNASTNAFCAALRSQAATVAPVRNEILEEAASPIRAAKGR